MVVAAGALEAQAQEELREILNLLVGVDHLPVPDRGRVAAGLAGGGDDVADELVVGLVLRQARADPLVEGIAAVAVEGVVGPLVPQDRRPLVGESVGVVGAVEEPVDEFVALVGIGVGEEGPRLVERGDATGDVDRRPAEERGVVAPSRRRERQRHEVVEDVAVDEVPREGIPVRNPVDR